MSLRFLPLRQQAFRGLTTAPSAGPARRRPTTPSPAPGREVLAAPRAPGEPSPALLSPTQRPPRGALPQRCSLKGAHRGESYLQLLVRVLLWVLAALALLPQLLQLGLALVQCVALAPLLRLVLLQRGLRGKDHRATAEPTALPAPAQRQPGLRAPAKPRRGGQKPAQALPSHAAPSRGASWELRPHAPQTAAPWAPLALGRGDGTGTGPQGLQVRRGVCAGSPGGRDRAVPSPPRTAASYGGAGAVRVGRRTRRLPPRAALCPRPAGMGRAAGARWVGGRR